MYHLNNNYKTQPAFMSLAFNLSTLVPAMSLLNSTSDSGTLQHISSRGGDGEGVGGVSGSGHANGGVRGHISGGGGSGEGIGDGVSRKVSGQHNGEGIEESCRSVNALSRKKRVASSTNDS